MNHSTNYQNNFFAETIKTVDQRVKVRTKGDSGDLSVSAFFLIFLKYAIDNHIGAKNMDEMEAYLNLQRYLSSDVLSDKMAEYVGNAFKVIEGMERYDIEGILRNEEVMDVYEIAFTGGDQGLRIDGGKEGSITEEERNREVKKHFLDVCLHLNSVNLKDPDHTLGKELVDSFYATYRLSSRWNKEKAGHISRDDIAEIGKAVLQMEKGDCFLDFAAGVGEATISITKDCQPAVINMDIDPIACAIDAMCLIMYGYEKVSVSCKNTLLTQEPAANKLFTDLRDFYDGKADRNPLAAALNFLQEGESSTGIITVNGKFLGSTRSDLMKYKRDVVHSRRLYAVIQDEDTYFLLLKNNSDRVRFLVLKEKEPMSEKINRLCCLMKNDGAEGTAAVSFDQIGYMDDEGSLKEYSLLPEKYNRFRKEGADPEEQERISKELEHCYRILAECGESYYAVKEIDEPLQELCISLRRMLS